MSPGGGPGLQHRGGPRRGPGGFDPRAPPLRDIDRRGGRSRVDVEPIDPRRATPGTDALLATPELIAASERVGRDVVKRAVHRAQRQARAGAIDPTAILDAVVRDLPRSQRSIERVINATGVVVHTNLGRAPLSAAARESMLEAAGYSTVELDLRTAARAPRGRHVLDLLAAAAPGAEAAMVVNNNAAALALVTDGAWRRPRGGDQQGRARGDRRRVPDRGNPHGSRRASAGSRLDQPDDARRLRRRDLAAHRIRDQGPPGELRDLWLRGRCRCCRPGRPTGRSRRRHRIRPAPAARGVAR